MCRKRQRFFGAFLWCLCRLRLAQKVMRAKIMECFANCIHCIHGMYHSRLHTSGRKRILFRWYNGIFYSSRPSLVSNFSSEFRSGQLPIIRVSYRCHTFIIFATESPEACGQQSALATAFQMGFDCHSLGRTAWNIWNTEQI